MRAPEAVKWLGVHMVPRGQIMQVHSKFVGHIFAQASKLRRGISSGVQ
jgi:hypothetical protein